MTNIVRNDPTAERGRENMLFSRGGRFGKTVGFPGRKGHLELTTKIFYGSLRGIEGERGAPVEYDRSREQD